MKIDALENPKESIKKLGELIKDIGVAMMTTVDSDDGSLTSRPMIAQQMEFDGDLWFFTSRSSGKIDNLLKDQHVNLAYSKPGKSEFVSVSGRVELINDKSKIKELWNPLLKAWFPDGIDDPEIILLKVHAEKAEYWDSPSSKIVKLFGFVKAVLTHERSEGAPGDHKKVHISN